MKGYSAIRRKFAFVMAVATMLTAVPCNVYAMEEDAIEEAIIQEEVVLEDVIQGDDLEEEATSEDVIQEEVSPEATTSDEVALDSEEPLVEPSEVVLSENDIATDSDSANDIEDVAKTDAEVLEAIDSDIQEDSELIVVEDTKAEAIESPYVSSAVLMKNEGLLPINDSLTYTVTPRNTALFTAKNEDGSNRTIGKLVLVGNVADTVARIDKKEMSFGDIYSLILYEGSAGKTIKVRIYDEKDAVLDTVTFKLLPIVNKVTVSGAKSKTIDGQKVNLITQVAGVYKTYSLNKDKSSSRDEIVLSDNGIFDGGKAQITEDGKKIIIRTDATSNGKSAVIKLYNKTADYKEVGEFTLKVSEPTFVKYAPSVKVINTTDTDINLSLALPKYVTIDDENVGSYYYRIEAQPVGDVIDAIDNNVVFVSATNRKYSLKVLNRAKGKGYAAKFNITTQLVMIDASKLPAEPTADDFAEAQIAISKQSLIKKASTMDAQYETKFKLSAKKTKLYTGQGGVIVAVPKFSSKTTFREGLSVNEITNKDGVDFLNKDFTAYVDGDNNIIVNAYYEDEAGNRKYPATGKYTIKVFYSRAEGQDPTSATVSFNVVRGIEVLSVNAPARIYKAMGAKASTKLSVTYNSNKDKPATRKVTYELLPYGAARRGVTINKKTGTITVPKKFSVVSSLEGNKIRVVAKASDYTGNTVVSDHVEIDIVNYKTVIKAINLSSNGKPSYIISDGDKLNKNDYLTVNAYSSESMTADSLLDKGLYTIKASGSMSVDGDKVHAVKAGKGYVTVTANDGAKASVKMTVIAEYNDTGMTLMIFNSDDMPSDYRDEEKVKESIYDIVSTPGEYRYDNNHDVDKAITVAIQEYDALKNIAFSVSGGIVKYQNAAGICFIPSKAESVVTITNKSTNKKYIIRFKNKKW